MLAPQSSLAESVDGDDPRSDDGEERPERPPTAHYYCLYLYRGGGVPQYGARTDEGSPGSSGTDTPPGEDFSLSLGGTNLPAEAEAELRSFMARRLSRGAMFDGMGSVASVDVSPPECSLGCYYCLIQQTGHPEPGLPAPEYVICFLGGTEKGLDLFRLELDQYVEEMRTRMQAENLDSDVRTYLSSWYEVSIMPIQRIVNLFQEKMAFLLHAALSYTSVEVTNSDARTKNDISRFLSSASLQGLVQEGTMASLCIAMTERQHHTVTVDFREGQPELLNAVTNRFCEDWMQFFISSYDSGSPFLYRQKLENFKLKAIQDMNILKRLIRQAESSHHALFRCYTFLKNCGNGDILLQMVKVEHAEMPEASSVVMVLEEFIQEQGVCVHSS